MSNRAWSIMVALEKASGELLNGPLDDEPQCVAAALAHLAPFFTQGVHPGTPERTGDVAENHGTGELVAQYPHTVKCQGDILLDTHRWSGELFKNFYLKEWETTLTKRLGDGDYDLELRFRRRL